MFIYKYRILSDMKLHNLNVDIENLMKPIENSWQQWQPKGRVRFDNGVWHQRMVLVDRRYIDND